ncbi:hypothetical protein IP84_11540 [beta proteobacterium AAP99]|nr:hypothetical protein IP84_11540 [beta proteobacterium AAP99]
MLNRKQLVCALAQVFGGLTVLAALPAAAQTNEPQRAERVEVTGSRIKRIDGEGASPVQVITRADIERTGAATINEVLQQVSSAGYGLDDRFTNGFAPGGGGLNLRGLGFNSTLVLVNGRRLPTYPFAQQVGTSQGFNDIQNIPVAAVERVEILKDGASAVYGADAVGGVVNLILRQDYTGVEIGGSIGQSSRSDGNTASTNLTAGFGSLASQGFNVLIGANYSKRDETKSAARGWANSEDLRARSGSDRRSSYGFPGTIVDTVTGDTIFTDPGCGPATQIGGSSVRAGFCRYDRASLGSLFPESEKLGLYSRGTVALGANVQAFGEVLFTRNKFKSVGWPAGSTDDVGIGSGFIPAGSPANPFPNEAEVRTRFADVGNRGDDGTSDTTRLVLGVKGVVAGWDLEAAANTNKIKIDNTATNQTLNSRVMCLTNPAAAASYAAGGDPLGLGTLNQIFAANPAFADYFRRELGQCAAAFAQYGYYNYRSPSANTPGVANYLRYNAKRAGESTLDGFDVKGGRELFKMDGGQFAVAFGAETRREKVSDVPDQRLQSGDTLSISASSAFGNRRITSVFAEANAPVLKGLEFNLAVRNDRYSGNGDFSATSPKVSVRYQPVRQILLRSTASEAFRAPSLFETTPAQQTSFAFGLQDPSRCPVVDPNNPDCNLDIRVVQRGNPNLKPEKSRVYTAGVVLEPTQGVTLSADWWQVSRKDEIGAFGNQLLLNLFPNNPAIVQRDAAGRIQQLFQVPVQLNRTKTYGTDLEMAFRTNISGVGTLTTRYGGTYTESYKFTTLGDDGQPAQSEFIGTYSQPRWRTNWEATLARGPWEYSLTGYNIGGYAGLGRTARVAGQDITNFGVRYTGIKNVTVRLQINNVFDRPPPFNDETSGSNAGYNPTLSDVLGRFYTLSATYKF